MNDNFNPYWSPRVEDEYLKRKHIQSAAARRVWDSMEPEARAVRIARLRKQQPKANKAAHTPATNAKRSLALRNRGAGEKAAIQLKRVATRNAARAAQKAARAAQKAAEKAAEKAAKEAARQKLAAFYRSPEGSIEMTRRANVRWEKVKAAREKVKPRFAHDELPL